MELREFLKSRFDKDKFIEFLSQRFYGFEANNTDSEFLGSVKLDDRKEIGFFVFKVDDDKDIENARVSYSAELKKYAKEYMLDGAIGALDILKSYMGGKIDPSVREFIDMFTGILKDTKKSK
jgi:hypothetical protein